MWAVFDAEAGYPTGVDVVLLEAEDEHDSDENDAVGDDEAQFHFKPSVNWKCNNSSNDKSCTIKIVIQIEPTFIVLCHEDENIVSETNS